jgi:phospholipid/cholesterol/gamma-HCH transport system permease protein
LAAALAISDTPDGSRVLALSGRLDAAALRSLWGDVRRAVDEAATRPVVVDAADVDYCDGAGAALLVDLLRHPRTPAIEVRNLRAPYDALLAQFDPVRLEHDLDPEVPRRPVLEEIGRAAAQVGRDTKLQVAFIGETTAALVHAATHPHTIRWKDVWRIAERAGADALPIVALISFLLGMILAFQSAVPMKRFGAEIFVADLIGLAMLRELGPLMTAILLAGRSGAAFAAEIGTMRVNQEVDALVTMGLDPVRFLVAPRIIASLLMTPLLTLFANVIGLLGGAVTMQTFGIPFLTFFREADAAVNLEDFLAGFVKSFVFAVLVAGIGCLRGLQTTAGASAVGEAATRAVVSGIILLVIVDGLFALTYYMLDI